MVNLMVLSVILAQAAPLTLKDCLQEALARHPDVAISRTDVRRAEAQKTGTRAGYLPRLDLGLQNGYLFSGRQEYIYSMGGDLFSGEREASHTDTHSFSLRLSQTIFDGGKMWKQAFRANKEIDRAKLGVLSSMEEVALGAISAFFELGKAQRQLEVLTESLEVSRGQLDLAEERLRLGAASKVDVSLARVSVGEDRIAIERQNGVIDSAVVELNLALGRPPSQHLAIRDSSLDGKNEQPEPVPDAVLEDHVQLRGFDQASEVAKLDVEIAKGDWWPHITGSIAYSRQDPEFYKVYSRFDELYTLTFLLNISFPVFDGFLRTSRIEEADVQLDRISEEKRRIHQDLQAVFTRAVKNLDRLVTIARIEEENVQAAEQQLVLARERYEVGEGTALEIRDAQLAVTRARLAKVQTEYDLKIAGAQYHYARGDLLDTYLGKEHP
jgi:outer membrane protein